MHTYIHTYIHTHTRQCGALSTARSATTRSMTPGPTTMSPRPLWCQSASHAASQRVSQAAICQPVSKSVSQSTSQSSQSASQPVSKPGKQSGSQPATWAASQAIAQDARASLTYHLMESPICMEQNNRGPSIGLGPKV